MEVLWMGKDRESVQQIWELWRHIVLWAAEIGIAKKKLMDRSRGWWSREIEAAIQAWKVSCRKLREARSGNVGNESLLRQWEEYKSAGRNVKRLIRLEKKRLRKATIERIESKKTCEEVD